MSDEEFARAYGSLDRVEWVRSLPSVASGKRPCVNAHVRTGGMGRKADARWIVPLTWEEHERLHRRGPAWFETTYGIDLDAKAAETEVAWQAYSLAPRPTF